MPIENSDYHPLVSERAVRFNKQLHDILAWDSDYSQHKPPIPVDLVCFRISPMGLVSKKWAILDFKDRLLI
jgi:hypothetical protein